jgi:DNA-binding GntR family transcriptional regulator
MDPLSQRKNDASHVYSKLKQLLVNYRFKPDTQLHPAKLAGRLNVSSTPVREALHRLAAEHLLMSIPNKGFYAKVLALEEMTELFVLSNVLLQHAIAASHPPLNGAQAPALPASLAGPIQVDHAPSVAQFIEEAFSRVAGLSRNQSLSVMIRNFNDRTHYIRTLDLELVERRSYFVQQTSLLVDQVRRQNTSEAIRNLQDQLRSNVACLPDLVKEGLARSYATADACNMQSDRVVIATWG